MKVRRSYLAALGLLALLSFFRLAEPTSFDLHAPMSPFFQNFPETIGSWSGEDTPPDERTMEILETRNVLSREYSNADKEKAHLLLVSSNRDRRVAHPPEVCYLGSNFNIVDDHESVLPGTSAGDLKVREFRAQHERFPDHSEEVLYLYKVGGRFTTNYYAQQLQFALDRLSGKETQVMLIRISSSSYETARRFLRELLPNLL